MNALERPDPARLSIIRKRIEHGARHMIVNPVDWTGIARTRIGFQVVNAHAASWPLPDANMSIVDPDVAAPLRRRRQVDGDDERSFRWNARGPFRQTCLGDQMRDRDVWFRPRSRITRLGACASRKYLAICSPYAGRLTDSFITVLSPGLGIWFANDPRYRKAQE